MRTSQVAGAQRCEKAAIHCNLSHSIEGFLCFLLA